jgi:hypothetical protein
MPQNNIFFCMQSSCRIDGWPQDWILSITFFPQTAEKKPFFFRKSINRSEMLMPQNNIFFWMQSFCRIDGRHQNLIFNRICFPFTVSTQTWERVDSETEGRRSAATRGSTGKRRRDINQEFLFSLCVADSLPWGSTNYVQCIKGNNKK